MVFPVFMYGCESWTVKKAEHWRIDALNCGLEKTLEGPLDCKEIQPVHPEGDQSWVFIGRTDTEANTPILWSHNGRAGSFEQTLMLGNIEGRRRGWQKMRWLDGITDSMDMGLGRLRQLVMDRGLVCCGSRGRKELDTTERLKWTESSFSDCLKLQSSRIH